MNDDRTLERAARSWLELGPTQAPDRAVDAALSRIQTTRQERGLSLPWSHPRVGPAMRFAGAAIVAVLVVGLAVYALRPMSNVGPPGPTAAPSPTATATPNYPTSPPFVLQSALPVPPGDPLPANFIGRTYEPVPAEVQGTQRTVLTLRAADDPQCVGIYGGASTCFTVLWEPNGPSHVNDPGARGSARIVDGNLVLGFAWVPNSQSCEQTFGTFAIEDAGATLRGIVSVCAYSGFRAI